MTDTMRNSLLILGVILGLVLVYVVPMVFTVLTRRISDPSSYVNVTSTEIHPWHMDEARLSGHHGYPNYQIDMYGHDVIIPERAVTITTSEGTFNGRITSPTTITVDTGTARTPTRDQQTALTFTRPEEIERVLGEAAESQKTSARGRTIMWEKDNG